MPTASTASAHDRPAARGCATASSSRASAFAYVLSGRADVGHPRERKASEPLLVDPLIDTGGGGGPLIGGRAEYLARGQVVFEDTGNPLLALSTPPARAHAAPADKAPAVDRVSLVGEAPENPIASMLDAYRESATGEQCGVPALVRLIVTLINS